MGILFSNILAKQLKPFLLDNVGGAVWIRRGGPKKNYMNTTHHGVQSSSCSSNANHSFSFAGKMLFV